jgi:hypothetical protein
MSETNNQKPLSFAIKLSLSVALVYILLELIFWYGLDSSISWSIMSNISENKLKP